MPKSGLLPRILIAIALGIGAGYICPDLLARCFATFNGLFSSFLAFIVPLLIVGFVAPAIADIGNKAGKMLICTTLLAYAFTIMAGLISYLTADSLFPSLIGASSDIGAAAEGTSSPEPFFRMEITPLMGVLSALVLAFVLGLGVAHCGAPTLRNMLNDFRDIIAWVINKAIIPLLPLYIFGIFLDMTIAGQVGSVLLTFIQIIAVIFAMHAGILILQYLIASPFSHKNPFRCLWTMLPAYLTALGTQSSAATIPVTLRSTVAMGVDKDVAGFIVPLCATIHMSGSTLKIVACALALMISNHIPYDFPMFAGFIAMLGITIIAAPGVPGGAIMASLGLLSSMLGFSEADCALMIALYIAMDSFGTACNVTGDGAIALIINRYFGKTTPKV